MIYFFICYMKRLLLILHIIMVSYLDQNVAESHNKKYFMWDIQTIEIIYLRIREILFFKSFAIFLKGLSEI